MSRHPVEFPVISIASPKLPPELPELLCQNSIETSAATLRAEFREGNLNLIKWIVPLLIGQTAVVAALVKLV